MQDSTNYYSSNYFSKTFNINNTNKVKEKNRITKNSNTNNPYISSHEYLLGQLDFDNKYFIKLFGLNFYMDDIIILSILYFLYLENINDNLLYISLFLTLLA